MKSILYLCLCFFALSSCKQSEFVAETKQISAVFDVNQFKDGKTYIVVIPNQGCSSCITAAEEFFLNHKDRDDVYFVFTKLVSKKLLINKMKRKMVYLQSNHLLIDDNNLFEPLLKGDEKIYPTVFVWFDGAVKEAFIQSPSEEGLSVIPNGV